VPLPTPRPGKGLADQLAAMARIVAAAEASVVAVDAAIDGAAGVDAAAALGASLLRLDDLAAVPATADLPPPPAPDDVAYLQFTSGSTSTPKGVTVTHGNVVNQAAVGADLGFADPDARAVSWLPIYHDMGLVAFLLWPLIHRTPSWQLPTFSFLKRPTAWLELIDRVRGTISFAPNFAYELAARRATDEQLDRWDLSCWRLALCGAEPVRAETIRTTIDRLGRARLSPSAFTPGYGMAEATLVISYGELGAVASSLTLDADALRTTGQAVDAEPGPGSVEVVSCGTAVRDTEVAVVGPDGALVPERREGEIVCRGPGVAPGYFHAPEATGAALQQGWLHTGDRGFVAGGELYVTGREKDLVIVRGQNYHPHDVEWCAGDEPGVRPGRAVAIAVPGSTTEEMVVALEAPPDADAADVCRRVAARVAAVGGLRPAAVVAVADGEMQMTSSGKLRRSEMQARYLAGTLAVLDRSG
jgi:fatty-acyl-CoA synthase